MTEQSPGMAALKRAQEEQAEAQGIQLGLSVNEEGKIIMHFGKEIAWVGFDPDQAMETAKKLIELAGSVLGINIKVRVSRDD